MTLEQDLQSYARIKSAENLSGYDKKPSDVYGEITEKMNSGSYSDKELQDYFAFLAGSDSNFNAENFKEVPKILPWTRADYLALDKWIPVAWDRIKTRVEDKAIAAGYQFPHIESAETYYHLIFKKN